MPIPTKHQFIKEAEEIYGLMEERRDYASLSNGVNIISLGLVAFQSIKTPILSNLLKKQDEELADSINQLLTQNEEVKASTSLKNILNIIQQFINLSNGTPVAQVEHAFRVEEREVNVSEKNQTLEDTFHIQFQRVPERFKLLNLFEQTLKIKLLAEKEAELISANAHALQGLEIIENRFQNKLAEDSKANLCEQQRLRNLCNESEAAYDKLLAEQQRLQFLFDKAKELLDDETISHASTRSELEETKDKLHCGIINLQSALETLHEEVRYAQATHENLILDNKQLEESLKRRFLHQQIQAKHIDKQDVTITALKHSDPEKELIELKKQYSKLELNYLHLKNQNESALGTLHGEREVNAKLRHELNTLKYSPQTNLFKPSDQQIKKPETTHKKKHTKHAKQRM